MPYDKNGKYYRKPVYKVEKTKKDLPQLKNKVEKTKMTLKPVSSKVINVFKKVKSPST